MNVSATFIHKPIATSMLIAAILLLGLISYELLPVAALPNIDSPTILVTAGLPGADAQTVASTVTTPLERQFGQIPGPTPGLTQMTSSNPRPHGWAITGARSTICARRSTGRFRRAVTPRSAWH